MTTHPLNTRRKSGRQKRAADPLEQSAKVLDAIDAGAIERGRAKPVEADVRASAKKRLTELEELTLCRRVRDSGDIDARNELVRRNQGLIRLAIGKHARGADYDDSFQLGALGLIRALETFDPDRGIRLSTYAMLWMRAFISRGCETARRAGSYRIEGTLERGRLLSLSDYDPLSDEPCEELSAQAPQSDVGHCMDVKRVVATMHDVCSSMPRPATARLVARMRILGDSHLHEVGDRANLCRESIRAIELDILSRTRVALGVESE